VYKECTRPETIVVRVMFTELAEAPSTMSGWGAADYWLGVLVSPVGGAPAFPLSTPHEELAIVGLLPLVDAVDFKNFLTVTIVGVRWLGLPVWFVLAVISAPLSLFSVASSVVVVPSRLTILGRIRTITGPMVMLSIVVAVRVVRTTIASYCVGTLGEEVPAT
jgi:hypothetical protein